MAWWWFFSLRRDGSGIGAAREETLADDDLGPTFEHFARGDWSAAYRELGRLAERGVPQAARIASMMQARGTRLFGGSFAHRRTVDRPAPKRIPATDAPVRTRVAVAGVALVVAGVASAFTILVDRAEPSSTGARAALPAPAASTFLKSVPDAMDVLPPGDDAPQADLSTYGG